MYALRDNTGAISGATKWPNNQSDKKVDEGSAEWLAYINKLKSSDQIAELESSVTPRRAREAVLTEEGKSWLKSIDDQIAALRG